MIREAKPQSWPDGYEREAANAVEKLKRLYKLIEDGVAEMDDLLEERITALKANRDRSKEARAQTRSNVKAKSEVTEVAVAIRLHGRKDILEQCAMAGATANPGVHTFVPEWRARQDSNL